MQSSWAQLRLSMQISPLLGCFWRTGPGKKWQQVPWAWTPALLSATGSSDRDSHAWENRTQRDRAKSSPPFFPFSSFLLFSGCCIWEEENDKIFSPSPFLLKQVSQLSSYPRGMRIMVPFISTEGRWCLRWTAPDQPVSDESHLFLRGKSKAWKNLQAHKAAALNVISLLIPA